HSRPAGVDEALWAGVPGGVAAVPAVRRWGAGDGQRELIHVHVLNADTVNKKAEPARCTTSPMASAGRTALPHTSLLGGDPSSKAANPGPLVLAGYPCTHLDNVADDSS